MKICYTPKNFADSSLSIIDTANGILEEYDQQGFTLTLRQLYYQFVARDLFPENRRWSWTGTRWIKDPEGIKNALPNYKWLVSLINDARLAGLIDWDYLVDRTRELRDLEHFVSRADALQKLAGWYHIDFWEHQDYRPEVWIEKDALIGVIEGVCQRYDTPYFSCRGFTSQSEMWAAAQRLLGYVEQGQEPVIIHLGDHDPSGCDMSRDVQERLQLFMGQQIDFRRIALNMNQVQQYNPPPNPAKLTDSRSPPYIAQFGTDSWELDALDPATIIALIRSELRGLQDTVTWELDRDRKNATRTWLQELASEEAENS